MTSVDGRPKLTVMDMYDAREYEPGPNEACISILSPYPSASSLPDEKHEDFVSDGFEEVLRLRFHDYDKDHLHRQADLAHMSRQQAKQVADFVWRNQHRRKLVIHCEAGVSRSPAVALAAMRILPGYSSEDIFRAQKRLSLYNRFVRRIVVEEAYGMGLID